MIVGCLAYRYVGTVGVAEVAGAEPYLLWYTRVDHGLDQDGAAAEDAEQSGTAGAGIAD